MWTPEHRRAADRHGLRYPSDLSDAEWALVEPLIPPARHGVRGGGKVGHWSGGDVRPRRSKIQPVVRRFFVLWTKGSRRDVRGGGLRGGSAICFQ